MKEKLKILTGNDAVDEIFGQLIDVLNQSKSIVQKIVGIQIEDNTATANAVDGVVDSKTYVNITNADSGFGVEISGNFGRLAKTDSLPSPPSIGGVSLPDHNGRDDGGQEIAKVHHYYLLSYLLYNP